LCDQFTATSNSRFVKYRFEMLLDGGLRYRKLGRDPGGCKATQYKTNDFGFTAGQAVCTQEQRCDLSWVSMSNPANRIEVVTSVQRRRRWTASEKVRMVEETFEPGMTVSLVARRHGVAPNHLFTSRHTKCSRRIARTSTMQSSSNGTSSSAHWSILDRSTAH
jgi:transposase-like protein